jgi:hypothetical protein
MNRATIPQIEAGPFGWSGKPRPYRLASRTIGMTCVRPGAQRTLRHFEFALPGGLA